MGTESWTVTNEKCRPEIGVELCDQCGWGGLKHADLFLCIKEAKMCLNRFPCHHLHLRGQGVSFQSRAETSACLVYSGFLHMSAPVQHNSAPDERRLGRRAVSLHRSVPGLGSVKAIGHVQRKQIFPCAMCSVGFFQLMPYKSLSVGQPARETYRLGNVHTINCLCSLKSIMASVKAQQEIALRAEVENSLRHRRRISLHSFQR